MVTTRPPVELVHRDAVAAASEPQVDPAVDQTLALHPLAEPVFAQHVAGSLLEHPGPDPRLAVVAAARLEHDGLDPLAVEQMAEEQTGRPRADDRDLGALLRHRVRSVSVCGRASWGSRHRHRSGR